MATDQAHITAPSPPDPPKVFRPRVVPKPGGESTFVKDGTPGFFTRSELCDRSGLTLSEYNKLVQRRVLVSKHHNFRDWPLYVEADVAIAVESLQARRQRVEPVTAKRGRSGYNAAQASAVFEAVRQGKSIKSIYFATKIHPDVLNEILDQYEKICGTIFLNERHLEAINACAIEGFELPIRTAADVVKLIRHLTTERRCSVCDERPPSDRCARCVKASAQRARAKIIPAPQPTDRSSGSAASSPRSTPGSLDSTAEGPQPRGCDHEGPLGARGGRP